MRRASTSGGDPYFGGWGSLYWQVASEKWQVRRGRGEGGAIGVAVEMSDADGLDQPGRLDVLEQVAVGVGVAIVRFELSGPLNCNRAVYL